MRGASCSVTWKSNRKAVVIYVPFRLRKAFHKIHPCLVRELEKKFSGKDVIFELRSFTDLGLKEAKALVEKTLAILIDGLSKEEGEKIVEKLKALGAKDVLE
ncbi:Ribosomal protein L7/L12 C-terminal [Arabidopsis suecica]|uniref:40S ribosomal protein S7 n=1 Tax=Arabidopsis suecica TaxID=45249 RepID=A0A8T1XZE7_ARASU|nr:Ribosomal protein L7/L12 C-terminal [Arabidopsis suecica]